jgi:hypothetical protein
MPNVNHPRYGLHGKDNPCYKSIVKGHRTVYYNGIQMPEYRYRIEKLIGKSLPIGSEIHHHTPEQLVVCQDRGYHKLLHLRTKALKASGHAKWRKCRFCQIWDSPKNLHISRKNVYHTDCRNLQRRHETIQKRLALAVSR